MTCAMPPELQDRELLAYLQGEADDAVEAHLQKCPGCRQRARALAGLQARLTARLYRVECPTPHELGEYHLGLLPSEQAAALGQHLDRCLHCAAEVAQLAEYLRDLAPALEASPVEQARDGVRRLVARLVEGWEGLSAPVPALAPAYAGVRGEPSEPQVYAAGDVQIVLDVQADAAAPDRASLLGLVLGIEPDDVTVELRQAGETTGTAALDERGNFVLTGLQPGAYALRLAGPGVEVDIEALEIGVP
jgi:anti-sigma factor RsiW